MTTALTLITAGYREGNLIPVGQAPSTAEQAESLDLLNRIMLGVFGLKVGTMLQDWNVPDPQFNAPTDRTYPLLPGADIPLVPPFGNLVPDNSRIIWDGSTQVVYLASKPNDGAVIGVVIGTGSDGAVPGQLTVDGNSRFINGAKQATFQQSAFTPALWFYRADLATWMPIAPLTLTSPSLFPVEFDDLWATGLALRLAPRYGKQLSPATTARYTELSSMLQARYFQDTPVSSRGDELVAGYQSFRSFTNRWFDPLQ